MRSSGPFAVSAALATAGAILACPAMERPCRAFVMSPAVPFLETEVGRALQSLRAARATLPAEGADARQALDEAESALMRLHTYYVPLLEARQRASNAGQHFASGELRKADGELALIEKALLTLGGSGDEDIGRQVEEPLDLLEEARVALARGSPEASLRLEDLAERLELLLLKGDLILD